MNQQHVRNLRSAVDGDHAPFDPIHSLVVGVITLGVLALVVLGTVAGMIAIAETVEWVME